MQRAAAAAVAGGVRVFLLAARSPRFPLAHSHPLRSGSAVDSIRKSKSRRETTLPYDDLPPNNGALSAPTLAANENFPAELFRGCSIFALKQKVASEFLKVL